MWLYVTNFNQTFLKRNLFSMCFRFILLLLQFYGKNSDPDISSFNTDFSCETWKKSRKMSTDTKKPSIDCPWIERGNILHMYFQTKFYEKEVTHSHMLWIPLHLDVRLNQIFPNFILVKLAKYGFTIILDF